MIFIRSRSVRWISPKKTTTTPQKQEKKDFISLIDGGFLLSLLLHRKLLAAFIAEIHAVRGSSEEDSPYSRDAMKTATAENFILGRWMDRLAWLFNIFSGLVHRYELRGQMLGKLQLGNCRPVQDANWPHSQRGIGGWVDYSLNWVISLGDVHYGKYSDCPEGVRLIAIVNKGQWVLGCS